MMRVISVHPADEAERARRACEQAREADLFRRTNAVMERAVIARDAMRTGPRRDLVRAEKLLGEIATLAGGGEIDRD